MPVVEIRFFNGSATEVTASISAPRCCTESSAFGRFVLVAKLIHLLGATAGLHYAVHLFQNIWYVSSAGPCADTTVHTLVFQLLRYPTNSWISFYVPVLRSWLVASTLINFQQISECKLTQLYSLPDTGKKADKKRYLFTRPRKGSLNPSGLLRVHFVGSQPVEEWCPYRCCS